MTFYEAALRVLEAAGKPLHVQEITQQSIAQSLLSHVGKTPEQTMLSRLAAMARRPKDRRVIVTAKDTFALSDWQLPEDADALAVTGVPEPNPEEDLPPLRPEERHPIPQADIVRSAGRGERKRRFDDEDRGRRRRFPPLAEVAFELLSEASSGLTAEQLLNTATSRELAGEELSTTQLLTALLEDNQRRVDAGRRPQFAYEADGALLVLEPPDSARPALELQTALAAVAGIAMEGGRPVIARHDRGGADFGEELEKVQAAKGAVKDARRAMARVLRRRLGELDVGTFEKAVVRMMQGHGFRELKVAKRSKDGPLLTARKKEGSLELRYAIRLMKGNTSVDRRAIQDLRKDLGHYSAQIGLLVSAGELRGDARGEATHSGGLVLVWSGEALAEKFFDVRVGVNVVQLELYEVDDRFFDEARADAEQSKARREERMREKLERKEADQVPEEADTGVDTGTAEEGEEGEEAGEEGAAEGAQAGTVAGERKRRRRRRRRRRGGGQAEAGQGATAEPGAQALSEGVGENPSAEASAPNVESAERNEAPASSEPREPQQASPAPVAPPVDSGGPETN